MTSKLKGFLGLMGALGMILLVLVARSNYMILSKVEELEALKQDYYNMQQQLAQLRTEMNSMKNSLNQTVEDIRAEEQLFGSVDYDITNVNDAFETAEVDVNLHFNRLPKDASIFLMYKDINLTTNEWNTVELTQQGGSSYLDYATQLVLSYDHNYTWQVMVETSEDVISHNLGDLDLEKQLSGRIGLEVHFEFGGKGRLNYEIFAHNEFRGNEKLKLASIKSYLYYRDELVEELDVMQSAEKTEYHELEQWEYQHTASIENFQLDSIEEVRIEVVAVDKLGKEYRRNTSLEKVN